jgi:hypothetical protein
MDILATVITAAAIATGGATNLHVPGVAPPGSSIDTQVRFLEASGQRLQYLTSKEGTAYHKEQMYIECAWRAGSLANKVCPSPR